MAAYMTITVTLTEWRTKFRRTMIEFDNDAKQKGTVLSLHYYYFVKIIQNLFEINPNNSKIK